LGILNQTRTKEWKRENEILGARATIFKGKLFQIWKWEGRKKHLIGE
jgi:hypothetical protein